MMKKIIDTVKKIAAKILPKKVDRDVAIAEMQRQLYLRRKNLR